jgi:hypothetical protein
MSRRRARAKKSDRRNAAILMVLGISLIAGLGGAAFYARSARVELDPNTNCPMSGPSAIHAVLIDRSDPISPQQAQRIRQWAQLLKRDAAQATRFDIYTFEGDSQAELHPVLSVCSTQQDADPLYQNPEKVRRRYEAEFVAVLDKTIDDLLQTGTRPNSPIIESLRAAAQTSFGLVTTGRLPLRVTLISDLVQHTPPVSHFRSPPDFQQFSHNASWPRLRPELKGADVNILYVLRPTALRNSAAVQNRGHQEFWTKLIAASGGRVTEFTPF